MALDLARRVQPSRAALADTPATALVHAAGLLRVGALGRWTPDAGAAMWRLHVDAACRLADAIAPRLGAGGRMVLLGSRIRGGLAGKSQYAATKAAMVGLARSWAAELAPRGGGGGGGKRGGRGGKREERERERRRGEEGRRGEGRGGGEGGRGGGDGGGRGGRGGVKALSCERYV